MEGASRPEGDSLGADRVERAQAWLAHACAFALASAALKAGVNLWAASHRGDPVLHAGFALGVLGDVGLGALSGLAILSLSSTPTARVLSLAPSLLLLVLDAAAFHAHAVLRYLPGLESLSFLRTPGALEASFDEHASPLLLLAESALACALLWVLSLVLKPLIARVITRAGTAYACAGAALGVFVFLPFVTDGQLHHGATHPLMHLVTAAREAAPVVREVPPSAIEQLAREVDRVIGTDRRTVVDSTFPYCRGKGAPGAARTPRSIVLLILEGVGAREAQLSVQGTPVMPTLLRMASEQLSFEHFYAAGDRSSQGLVGLLSGIAPETHRRVLTHAPLVALPSLPRHLARTGYRTLYLHGSDLSFEQQRTYLKQLGIERIVEPTPEEMRGRLGWGLPDGAMFDKLVRELEQQRTGEPHAPYFATLFTVSTHDPYLIPEAEKRDRGDSDFARFVDSLRYLDRELARFYAWFQREEAPRGTLLLVVGDHTGRVPFPDDPLDTSTGEFEYRFRVPFVIAGLSPRERARLAPYTGRTAGHMDVPETVLGLLGLDVAHCFAGRDLFAEDWPAQRYVPSLSGENLSFMYLHDGAQRFMWALAQHRVSVFDEARDPLFRHDLAGAQTAKLRELSGFVRAYFALGQYLNIDEHYAPRPSDKKPRSPRVAPETPLFASHRGRTLGPPEVSSPERGPSDNSLAAIEVAIDAGFRWVELDVQPTRDGAIVLAHDAAFTGSDGATYQFPDLTLAEARARKAEPVATLEEALSRLEGRAGLCLELKPQPDVFDTMRMVEGVLRAMKDMPRESVIIDSFSRNTLASFAALSPFEVGYDLPQKPVQDEWLDYAADADFEWVYVEQSFLSADVVRRIHTRGLKVMAYPVNERAFVQRMAPERVDGIISDSAAPWGLTPRR